MTRERGSCPLTGRVDESLADQLQEVEPDSLELAHIISQSISEGIKGVSEEARQKVGPLPKTILYHEPH